MQLVELDVPGDDFDLLTFVGARFLDFPTHQENSFGRDDEISLGGFEALLKERIREMSIIQMFSLRQTN